MAAIVATIAADGMEHLLIAVLGMANGAVCSPERRSARAVIASAAFATERAGSADGAAWGATAQRLACGPSSQDHSSPSTTPSMTTSGRAAAILLFAGVANFRSAQAQAARAQPSATAAPITRLVINADLGHDTISRHIYGQFAEHLGRGIYDGVWTKEGSGTWHLRDDVIAALRRIEVPNVRWPGGCFADYYHWRDGIGPVARRPRMVNTIWGNVVEDNSFGTDEYMELVRRIGAEPFVVGNVGTGSPREMAEWWEYLNHPGGSNIADERKANGHAMPYHVRRLGIGNESWG